MIFIKKPLSEKKIDELYQLLNTDQTIFLNNFVQNKKKNKWKEITNEHMEGQIENYPPEQEWALKEILDGGYKNRPFRCECGKALRFQYIVIQKKTGKVYKLGETCFGTYTSMTKNQLIKINNAFREIDLERDEILIHLKEKNVVDLNEFTEVNIPLELLRQIKIGLPISNAQLRHIIRLKFKHKK